MDNTTHLETSRMPLDKPGELVASPPTLPTPPKSRSGSPVQDCPSPSAASEASASSSSSLSDDEKLVKAKLPPQQRVSIYVQVFEDMLQTVLERESYLFNEEEMSLMHRFSEMSYEARYLFVRLFSRKNGWFRTRKLAYYDEIADMQKTVDELCQKPAGPVSHHWQEDVHEAEATTSKPGPSTISIPSSPVAPPGGVFMVDSDSEGEKPDPKGKRRARATDPLTDRPLAEVLQEQQEFGLSLFAINESVLVQRADIDELLSLLSLDELKVLVRDLRVVSKQTTRPAFIEAIKRTTSNQSTLTSMFAAAIARSEAKKSRGNSVSTDSKMDTRGVIARQTELLIQKILALLGKCIKLESEPIRLFARLHLIFYRSVAYSEKTLTQAVLSRFKIRNYPAYAVKRSFSIFESRQALMDYEEALIIERRMEEYLGEALDSSKGRSTKKFTKEDRERGFKEGQKLFEVIYPRWKQLVAEAQAKDVEYLKLVKDEDGDFHEPKDDRLTYYRKRFLAGWPLTRVVYKGASILARLHEYDREVEVLQDLLGQSCFRRGKRGEWYDRLALVLMNHIGGDKQEARARALQVCKEGLAHPWTHLIYQDSLKRRIVRLEKALGVPLEERHPPVPGLKAAQKRIMKGEKLSEGETGKKSSWRGMDGAEISVEQLALECYEKEGWKGFHSENGILTTIFSLLFWDVIFAPIDGVFETAYQSAPLDLSTDAFAIVRAEMVQERLQTIADGGAYDLLKATDERERENATWCVGVRWGYEREDLLEIVQCLSPKALITICRVYAEEWSHRTGGVPDLFLWNFAEKRARFVEVKGPGDFLSETQKVWIDVLLSTEVEVELCNVHQHFEEDDLSMSEDERKRLSPLRKRKSSTGTTADRGAEPSLEGRDASEKPLVKAKSAIAKSDMEDSDEEEAAHLAKPAKKHKSEQSVRKKSSTPTHKSAHNENASAQRASMKKPARSAAATIGKKRRGTKKRVSASSGEIIVLSD